MTSMGQSGNDPDPVWHMGPLPDPEPVLIAEEAEYFDYWDSMQLAYNYDLLDLSEAVLMKRRSFTWRGGCPGSG